MTVVERNKTTPARVYDAARELAPSIRARAAEVESARRIPSDLLDDVKRAGCFRLLLPETNGGLAAAWPAAMRVFEELARADASVGWTVMIGAGSWLDLAELPRETFDNLFAGREDVIFAGAFNPTGSITPVKGGYRVEGRWAFASGCEHADWLFANCVEEVVDGVPHLRGAVFSRDEVEIEDTWKVSGLRGTGSHHFHVDGLVVPAERTFVPLAGEPCIDGPITRMPLPGLIALGIAGIALGTAQGALDDILELAAEKVPLLAPGTIATNALFQYELAGADTDVRAARALLYDTAEAAWAQAAAGTSFAREDEARIRAAAVWSVARAEAVVDFAYRSGGGSAVYQDSPLQRRLRDIHAITQHFLVKRDTYTTAGAILAGQEVDVFVF